MDHRARRIETAQDIEAVLRSRASFREYMDCSVLARQLSRWDLVGQVGEAALAQELGRSHMSIPSIQEAARVIADSCIGRAASLDTLSSSISDAEQRLDEVAARIGPDASDEAIAATRNWLEQLRLLIADSSAPSCTKLCSQLRDIGRPDLGIEAATKALDRDPNSAVALNTRAAAKLDMGNVPGANSDIRRAWDLEPTSFVANTFSRVLLAEGHPDLAIEKARHAFRLDKSRVSAHSLLRAAAAANDTDAFEDAKNFLRSSGGEAETDETPDYWIETLAAEALIDTGQLDEAARMLKALQADVHAPKKRVQQLRNKLKHHQQSNQGRLDLSQ